MTTAALFLAVFLASAVEAVEAATVVLASGTAREWRSSLFGVFGALGVLGVIVVVFGPAISAIPLNALRLFVGTILLVFGLQWLRKAILRASGYKALHDEDALYREEVRAAESMPAAPRGVTDWYAFTLCFKSVFLEGLEVAFIVLTFGTNQHDVPLAVLAGTLAVVVVAAVAVAVRAPLSRVPENALKFVVGVMLTSFGMFWSVEGAHGDWPGGDLALLVIVPFVGLLALCCVRMLRRRRAAQLDHADARKEVAA
jgi:uncharacterized membrane protein